MYKKLRNVLLQVLTNPKQRLVVVVNTDTTSTCVCDVIDIDECAESTHNCSQECRDLSPGFECLCYDAYRMSNSTCVGKKIFCQQCRT